MRINSEAIESAIDCVYARYCFAKVAINFENVGDAFASMKKMRSFFDHVTV